MTSKYGVATSMMQNKKRFVYDCRHLVYEKLILHGMTYAIDGKWKNKQKQNGDNCLKIC